jgi:Holliday junction DNA helicase RuvA
VIVRVHGRLEAVRGEQALVEVGGFTIGIFISPWVGERLVDTGMVGRDVTFHTMYYIEGGFGMGNLIPRLVGFLSEDDMEFFTLLITVQGLGVRKALRALMIPSRDMARAIEMNDLLTLKRLPEIGSKTAQKIVMELRGKVTGFAHLGEGEIPSAAPVGGMDEEYQREAHEVLLQLQYTETEASELVVRTSRARPDITTSQELIQEIFRRQVPRR